VSYSPPLRRPAELLIDPASLSPRLFVNQSPRSSNQSSGPIGTSTSGENSPKAQYFLPSSSTRLRLYRDANVSHIASGFIYNSPSLSKVRVDEAYDSTLGSSLFDYTNVTQEGVANQLWSLSPAVTSPPECFQGFSNPAFPLISEDILVANEAIYGGVMYDAFAGEVALVSFDSAISCICTMKRYLLSLANCSSHSGTYFTKEPSQ
jgi:hypothetical protein